MITKTIIKIMPPSIRNKIEHNYELRKIMGNINWLTFENILRNLIGLFVFAWVARYLGPEQFGLMNYALAFVALFAALATLGLDNIVIRNIVSNPEKEKEYLGSTLVLKFFGSLVMLLLCVISIFLIEPVNTLTQLFVFIIAFGYIFNSFDTIDFWFQSQVQSKYSVYSRSFAFLITSALKISFIVTQAPLIAFVLMFLLDSLVTAIFLIYFYHKKTKVSLFEWKIKYGLMKDLLKDSWPLILSGIAIMIYMRIDQVMIGIMLGDAQLGIYSAAVKLSEAWYFIPMIIAGSVFPAILKAREKSRELYLHRLQILYDSFTWFTIIGALIITYLSGFIIKTIYGSEYLGAANVLSVLIFSGIFSFLGVASSQYLVAENLTKISFYRTLIGAVINVILNLMLIPTFGIIGAAFATLVSYMCAAYLLNVLFQKSRIIFMMQTKTLDIFRILRYLK